MFKKIVLLASMTAAMFYAGAAFAAVDVNKAGAAELDGVKGIGPSLSGKILDARKTGNFKDWPDLIERVRGVGPASAVRYSNEGLTVNGESFKGVAGGTAASAKPAKASKAEKSAAGADSKK